MAFSATVLPFSSHVLVVFLGFLSDFYLEEGYKKPFEPLMPSAEFLKFNELSGLEKIDETTCAVPLGPRFNDTCRKSP